MWMETWLGRLEYDTGLEKLLPTVNFEDQATYHQLAENAKKSENTIAKINSERNKNETVS